MFFYLPVNSTLFQVCFLVALLLGLWMVYKVRKRFPSVPFLGAIIMLFLSVAVLSGFLYLAVVAIYAAIYTAVVFAVFIALIVGLAYLLLRRSRPKTI